MRRPILSRRLTLEGRVRSADGAGGQIGAWVALGTLWADVEPLSGGALAGEAEPRARQTLRITCRAAPQGSPARPRAGQRLRDGERLFTILATGESPVGVQYLRIQAVEEMVR